MLGITSDTPYTTTGHHAAGVQHVVMVAPVDPDIDEAERIEQQRPPRLRQRVERHAMRRLQVQHHDGDDDGDHAIAERLDPPLAHGLPNAASPSTPSLARSGRKFTVTCPGSRVLAISTISLRSPHRA